MATNDTYISDKDGHRINPVLISNSESGGTEVLTIASNVANGSDFDCSSAIIWTDGTDVTVKIGTGAADVNDFLLLANQYIPMPVVNTSLLRFYGGTDSKKVYILRRT